MDRGRKPKRIGFANFAERWRHARAANVTPATAASHEWAIQLHVDRYFGSVELSRIAQEHVERFVADKLRVRSPGAAGPRCRALVGIDDRICHLGPRAVDRLLLGEPRRTSRRPRHQQMAEAHPHADLEQA